jgi:hypothetical protein
MVIPRHWNGPPGSANGGYTCGLVAALMKAPSAEVSLRAPPPLETELEVDRDEESLRLLHEGAVVAEGRATPPPTGLDPPRAVPFAEADAASRAGLAGWSAHHPFPTCVVCGPERDDGFGVYPGPLEDSLYAATWRGRPVAEEVWAALDCPSSAPIAHFGEGPAVVLARLHAAIDRLPAEGEALAVVSWPLGTEGRKREAASALVDADGAVIARARALWIELRN